MHPVALCQMCIAFGLVYLGLKEARYRIRTYESIAGGIRELVGVDTASLAYFGLLKAKPRFAECHHMIVDLISILPEKYTQDMHKSVARFVEDRVTTTKLRLFNFYYSNWDNWIVFVSSVLFPMLIIVVLHFGAYAPDGSSGTPIALSILILSAMVPPGLFVFLGIRMHRTIEKRIRTAVLYISREYRAAFADKIK